MLCSSHAGFALLVSRTCTSHENHCRVLTWSWISVGKHVGGDAIPSREHLPEILQSPLPVCMHNRSPDPVYPGVSITSDECFRLDKHISVTEDTFGSETQPLVPICDTYAIFEAIVLSSAKRKFPCQGSVRSLSPVDGGERPEQIWFADDVGGSPIAQLPTMSTTESGFAPRRAWAAMGLKLPIASTRTLACTATSACVTQSCTLISM